MSVSLGLPLPSPIPPSSAVLTPSPQPPKAAHYLKALDDARCEGDWSAIPELARKVRKHAPTRSCTLLRAHSPPPPRGASD